LLRYPLFEIGSIPWIVSASVTASDRCCASSRPTAFTRVEEITEGGLNKSLNLKFKSPERGEGQAKLAPWSGEARTSYFSNIREPEVIYNFIVDVRLMLRVITSKFVADKSVCDLELSCNNLHQL